MIKLLTSYSGAEGSHNFGDIVTLEKDHESRMVASGQAEFVAPVKKATVKK